MFNKKSNKGFTLIELLVVITIIGILAVGGFNIYTSQIQKARDSSRLKALDAIKLAVEQVYQDSSEYPHSNTFGSGGTVNVKTYMEKIPTDAKNGQTCNGRTTCAYIYGVDTDSNGINYGEYEISIAFENDGNVESKAETDSGNDGKRYESGINVDDSSKHLTSSSGSKAAIRSGTGCYEVAPNDGADASNLIPDATDSIYLSDGC